MSKIPYKKGWHEIGKNIYVYFQPNGAWGLNNAGLVTNHHKALLIDTLYDIPHTREMLNAINIVQPGFSEITMVVNTHADGDHFFGNVCVKNADIYSSETVIKEMQNLPPKKMSMLMGIWFLLGPAGGYAKKAFREFTYKKTPLVLPEHSFNDTLSLQVEEKRVELVEIKNAHKKGNIIVHIPEDKIVFAADLLFIDMMPIAWEGPLSNWIAGLDYILSLDVDTIVPGHGPIVQKEEVKELRDFFTLIFIQSKNHYFQGMGLMEAAANIDISAYSDWSEKERIISLVECVYRELNPEQKKLSPVALFGMMARLKKKKGW